MRRKTHADDEARTRGIRDVSAFESLLLLLLAAVLLAAAARRAKVPYPAFLALGGAMLGFFFPHGPGFQLDPSLALALFVAPVLLDAAYDASPGI